MRNKKWGPFLLLGAVVIVMLLIGFLLVNKSTNDKEKAEVNSPVNTLNEQRLIGFEPAKQPFIGDPKAPIVIVEFADYKCPYCKQWTEEVVPELKKEYLDTGKAVLYYVDLPFLAPDSTLAALAGETLYQQSQEYFWTYYKAMMKNQGDHAETWATKEFIMNLVQSNLPSVDMKQFEKELDSQKYIENVNNDIQIANDSKVEGTPTVFVNGVSVEDVSFAGIKAFIEK
ncbi:DsbA family protein [Paenibacillus segetis]|uniref:Disulfide bond formation protein D n=1 Tax=Paenibacillus segetis TaxID=1325360 RepID=A0ABQ1Y8K6_9BACL|nr:DsbA family protein [Paenibacillus segetis]GGH16545.1 disulfide bond formation protein D [Paenibacillus segetis]